MKILKILSYFFREGSFINLAIKISYLFYLVVKKKLLCEILGPHQGFPTWPISFPTWANLGLFWSIFRPGLQLTKLGYLGHTFVGPSFISGLGPETWAKKTIFALNLKDQICGGRRAF